MSASENLAYTRLIRDLRNSGKTVNETGSTTMAQCPAHDDNTPSLGLTPIRDRVLVKCYAGCETQAVVTALGRNLSDLFDHGSIGYHYSDGRIVKRNADKRFTQSGNTKGVALYGVEHIGDTVDVYVVEGEQDVDALAAIGVRAVSSAMGAGNGHLADWTPLRGKAVTIIPDMDESGWRHARVVRALLTGIAASIDVKRAKAGKDAADHVAHGYGVAELVSFNLPDAPADDGLLRVVEELAEKLTQAPTTRAAEPARLTMTEKGLGRSALRNLPKPTPLIDNVLDLGTTVILFGDWGTCKTFIALDLAASVATGRAWQGRKVERRRVLYVAAEGAFGIAGRLDAWEAAWQLDISDDNLTVYPEPVNLMDPERVEELAAFVAAEGYSFVLLDTMARCMVGGDENSARDVGIVTDAMTRVRQATPDGLGVVLGVHHTGKDGKTLRGSSSFEGNVDTVYRVIRDGSVIDLHRRKRKDGPTPDQHTLRLTPWVGTESCIVEAVATDGGETLAVSSEKLLQIFAEHFSETGATKAEFRDVAEAQGVSKTSFYRSCNDLLARGQLADTGTEFRPYLTLRKAGNAA